MTEYNPTDSESYDAIIALSASVDPSGVADAESKQRVATAVGLYHDGLASRIIMSGDHPFRSGSTDLPPAAKAMVRTP